MADPIKSGSEPAPSVSIAPGASTASARQTKGIPSFRPTIRPRWGFFKGLLTGAAIEVPAIAAGVWVLARLGCGDPEVPFMRIIRLTAIFAGIAAVFTAAGIGRLTAHASVDGGRKRAAWVGARAHAAASIGLVVIAAIPHGDIPDRSWLWLAYPITGIVVGAVCGALIGVVCGGSTPLGFSDVFALAKRPGGALKNLLAPEDLVKLGIALRDRTSSMFEGMFEPAAPRPDEESVPPQDDANVAPTTANVELAPADKTLEPVATPTLAPADKTLEPVATPTLAPADKTLEPVAATLAPSDPTKTVEPVAAPQLAVPSAAATATADVPEKPPESDGATAIADSEPPKTPPPANVD